MNRGCGQNGKFVGVNPDDKHNTGKALQSGTYLMQRMD